MAIVSSFAGNSLLHQGGGFQPLLKPNFSVVFYGVGNIDLFVLSIRETNFPALAAVKKPFKYFNESMHYAGAMSPFESQTLKFVDYMDRDLLKQLWGWWEEVWCPETGSIGKASSYKKSGDIFLLPQGGSGGKCPGTVSHTDGVRTWHIEGAWPVKLNYDGAQHENDGDPILIDLELSVDRAYPVF